MSHYELLFPSTLQSGILKRTLLWVVHRVCLRVQEQHGYVCVGEAKGQPPVLFFRSISPCVLSQDLPLAWGLLMQLD